ncbi:hypothetical protein [Streptomyces sp. EN16]|uniref:hypothetical protein n=1 Tax=Streptomyces sp. EN16 TaxID=212773 RepID=UPI00114CB269|nr:hypothetical protein [Streptomyces sp. EN16]
MSSELRRQLREALGPEIKGLQRAVALEIADDARYDDGWRFDAARGRRSKVRLADLVRWTGAKNERVVRDALRSLSLAGWEFRLPIGVGTDGRPMYAIPGVAMQYRVPDFRAPVAVTPEGTATTGPSVEQGTVTAGPMDPEGPVVAAQGPVTTAQEPAVTAEGPVVTGPPSPVLLLASPQDSPSSSGPLPSAGDEPAAEGGGGGDFLHQNEDRGAATGTPELHPQAEPLVAALDFRGRPPGSKQRRRLVASVAAALDAGWVEQDLKTYLDLGGAAVNSAAAVYAHRLAADELPDPATFREAARRPLEGTDAVVDGWMTLSRQLGDEREHAPAGNRASGRRGYSGPARPNTVWDRIAADAANGVSPPGAEKYKHCGTCDPVTRMRKGDDWTGQGKHSPCGRCHPSMQFS